MSPTLGPRPHLGAMNSPKTSTAEPLGTSASIPCLYFANVTYYGKIPRAYLYHRKEPLVGIAEVHLTAEEFAPLARSHLRKWKYCAIAPAIPSPQGGTYGGALLASKHRTLASPSATNTFSADAATHTSAHRDAVFFHAHFSGRRITIGCGYAREGNVMRLIHALACEFSRMQVQRTHEGSFDFLFAADWNKPPQDTINLFIEAGIPATAIVPDGPTCKQGNTTIDYGIASPALAQLLRVQRDTLTPWSPHCGIIFSFTEPIDTPKFEQLVKPKPLRDALKAHPAPDCSDPPTWEEARLFAEQSTPTLNADDFPGRSLIKQLDGANATSTFHSQTQTYAIFATALEYYQLKRTTLDERTSRQYRGRALPPKFKRVCAIGAPICNPRSTHGPHPGPAKWATLANALRHQARSAEWLP
jgi:hypothetical protein